MKCLVSHGYTNILPDFPIYSYNECIGPDGYMWGITARAWFLKAYDVMELLVQHGFDGFSYCINGYGNDIDDEMFRVQDIRGMTILLEHGYLRDSLKNLMKKYPNSPMTQYFKNNFLIQRKSLGIDPFKFKEIPKPQLEKKGLFHRNEIQRKNDLLLADYQDWLRAHEEYLVSLSKDKLIKISELNKSNKDIADLMIRVANVK